MPIQPSITQSVNALRAKENSVAHTLVKEQLKNCCGVYLLHNFFANPLPLILESYGRTQADRDRSYAPHTIVNEEWIKKKNIEDGNETKEQYRGRIRRTLEKEIDALKNKKSYFIAILNEGEIPQIEDVLLDVGFEILVPLTKNPTGSAITMYIYHLLPRPIEKKVVQSVIPRSIKSK